MTQITVSNPDRQGIYHIPPTQKDLDVKNKGGEPDGNAGS